MVQSTDLQSRRVKPQMIILGTFFGVLALALCLFVIGSCAYPGEACERNSGTETLAVFAIAFLVAGSGIILLLLAERIIPNRFPYRMVAGLITLMAGSVVSLKVSVPAWGILPLAVFFSFWAIFAVKYFVGIIYHTVNWSVKRAMNEPDLEPGLVDGQSQPEGLGEEAVTLTTFYQKGQEEQGFDQSGSPPAYAYDGPLRQSY
ncbi:hypothetical protein PG996_014028 [Apiospora saccharicola]|uniref:Uncharacterized protein n=1 Tax=Apiospora saccharicola TaxID=335842 RepID=A0ABR1TJR3_9PEZI